MTLTQERLKHFLGYNPLTGLFVARVSRKGRQAGQQVGSDHSQGYLTVRIDDKPYYLHRLAWLFVFGQFPIDMIDHKNGDKKDNRIENLREVTNAQNKQNERKARANKLSTKLLGVTFQQKSKRWIAQIKSNGNGKYLGSFATDIEAHAAYLAAKKTLHPFGEISADGFMAVVA